jgi:hypothetical protein
MLHSELHHCLPRYYMATVEGRPGERHMFVLNTSSGSEASSICLTSSQSLASDLLLAAPQQPPCLYSRIHLSPDFSTYIQVHSPNSLVNFQI